MITIKSKADQHPSVVIHGRMQTRPHSHATAKSASYRTKPIYFARRARNSRSHSDIDVSSVQKPSRVILENHSMRTVLLIAALASAGSAFANEATDILAVNQAQRVGGSRIGTSPLTQ